MNTPTEPEQSEARGPQQAAIDALPSAATAGTGAKLESEKHLEDTKKALLEIEVLELLAEVMPSPQRERIQEQLAAKQSDLRQKLAQPGYMLREQAQALADWEQNDLPAAVQAQLDGFVTYLYQVDQKARQLPGEQPLGYGRDGLTVCGVSAKNPFGGDPANWHAHTLIFDIALQPQPNLFDRAVRQACPATSQIPFLDEGGVSWTTLWQALKDAKAPAATGEWLYPLPATPTLQVVKLRVTTRDHRVAVSAPPSWLHSLAGVPGGAKSGSAAERLVSTGTLANLQAAIDGAKDQLDSMNELGEMDQLRLQMLTERRQKVLEMRSNLLKKWSETSATLVGNLK